MNTRTFFFLVAAIVLPTLAAAQNVHYGESFELNDSLRPFQIHEYTANNYIELKTGFHSEPNQKKYTTLQIDPTGIYPPESGLTGGAGSSDNGVVGTIGGTVDIGAMGAAIYSIPIEVPEGINGIQPHLSITYNSQAGNGLLGWGWDIAGLSSIGRTEKTRYHDEIVDAVKLNDIVDQFILDGARLIKVEDYTDSIEFKTEQDEMSRIMAYLRTETIGGGLFGYHTIHIIDCFRIWKADGRIMEYGTSEDSWINSTNDNFHALFWLLHKVSDRNGNSMIYHYNKNVSEGEYYINSIDYTKHTENGIDLVEPEFTVNFHYRSGYTQDYDFKYIAGNLLQRRKLVDHISINNNETNTELEKYSFNYITDSLGELYGYARMHNRLIEIWLEKERVSPNPTKIKWTSITGYNENIYSWENLNDTAIYKNFPFVGDFNGDGYSDLAIVPHMDSVYTHNVNINFFINNGASPGHFTYNSNLTLQNVDKRLDWLYPVDLNDDGLDDLVAYFYDSIAEIGKDTVAVIIYENIGGTHFESRDTIGVGGCRYLIRSGDFLGNGRNQLLLIPTISFPWFNLTFSLLMYHDGSTLHRAVADNILLGVRDIVVGDFNGDSRTEVLAVYKNGSTTYSLGLNNDVLSYSSLFSTNSINHSDRWHHIFAGDFNGDGKTDLLYNDTTINHQSRWKFFYSTGESFSGTGFISNLGIHEMPSFNLYSNSMRKLVDNYSAKRNRNVWNYSVCVADFDGDGVCDVAGINMNASSSAITIHSHYNPTINKFHSVFFGSNAAHAHYYFNCRSQYLHVGNFLGKDRISLLGLEYRANNKPGISALNPASELNSVKTVTDGIGNKVEFDYNYVQQPYLYIGHGVRRIPVPIRVLNSIKTENASDNPMIEQISYFDPCYHRDGHGWLGFNRLVRKTFENGAEVRRTVSYHSLEPMTKHAMLLPMVDTSYVFPNGEAVLASVTSYQFEKVLSNYGSLNANHLVTCPAMTGKVVVTYDPDNPGDILSKTFIENHYSYSNGLYNRTYKCNATFTGVGDPSASHYGNCEFRTMDSTVYYNNGYNTWTINRARKAIQVISRNEKPDVKHNQKYEYVADDSYLLSRIEYIPDDVYGHDPLSLRTDFEYYPDGNMMSKTVKAPYGQLGEQQKNYEYEYARHRLVNKETVTSGSLSYETSYIYDSYDRVDLLTEANGLATSFKSDPFAVTSWTQNADGTLSCNAKRWAQGHPLAPQGAMYYLWSRSSDDKQTLTFYHKTGAELRTVNYGLHGETIFTDKQYDGRGRLSAISDPYKEGETPRWTMYGYDGIDRLVTVTTADTTCTFTVYDGFLTEAIVTPQSGVPQTSSVTVNAMGWTVRSDDASGSYIVYDHYADGLMASATVNGNATTTVTATYDNARRRDTIVDPDYGTLTTVYDAYGRLKNSISAQESAAQTQTTYLYDGLDRPVTANDGLEGTVTQYSYNETGVKKGTLDEILFKRQGGANIQHVEYGYDTLARPIQVTEQRATDTRITTLAYDSQSRVNRLVYPSGVAVRYGYHHGYLMDVTDDDGHLLWRTSDMDTQGRLLKSKLGNGAVTRYTYDTVMHRLQSIVTTKNLQHLTYNYDKFGNLASRKDNKTNMEEMFTYDDMNRLTGITLKRPSGQNLYCTVSYDPLGRMTSRQAVTAVNNVPQVTTVFSQPVFDNTKVHAIASAQSTAELFSPAAQTVSYTSFDKVSKVKQGNDSLCYAYGYDRQRIFMEEHVGDIARTKQYWGDCERVTETDGNTTSSCWRTFITGPYGVFAVVENHNGVETAHYVLKDNLGSWTTITDGNGVVEQHLSYDAWGNLRNPNTWANYTSDDTFDKPLFDRGFTGHEHLNAFGLVNMNGRVYDPVMSSFLSADRYVQDPSSAQGFNRYAYCLYNPLRYVDPSGWLSGGSGGSGDGDHPPGELYYVNGMPTVNLPEVTVTDSPILNNEFVYTPYMGGGGATVPWTNFSSGQSIGSNNGGCGGGRGGYGKTSRSSDDQGFLSNLYPVISYEGVVIGYKQQQWQRPKTRAQKAINQKKAYEIQKNLKSKGVSKHVKEIKAGKNANLSLASKGIATLEIGLEVYDVINNKELMPSNVLNTTITIVSVWCWPIGGIYLVTDIGVLLFTGQSIGEHFDEWVGEPLIDFKP